MRAPATDTVCGIMSPALRAALELPIPPGKEPEVRFPHHLASTQRQR